MYMYMCGHMLFMYIYRIGSLSSYIGPGVKEPACGTELRPVFSKDHFPQGLLTHTHTHTHTHTQNKRHKLAAAELALTSAALYSRSVQLFVISVDDEIAS